MKYSLKDCEWKEFVLSDIFTISSTSSSIDRRNLNGKTGRIPYITRTDKNNGYDGFIAQQNDKYCLDDGNTITVGLDTQTVFYQSKAFYTGQNVQVLKSQYINRYTALFIIPLLKKQLLKFGWGSNGATLSRLKRSKILLPRDRAGNPDYIFMERYIREKEIQLLQSYREAGKRAESEIKKIPLLNRKEWGGFTIEELFTLEAGRSKGLNHLEQVEIGISYLGATNQNNGVLCLVKPVAELIQRGNCIAFIRNGEGSMGYSVYKSEDFIASSDISVGYNPNLNQYVGAFITTIADRVRGKYNFGYKRSGNRLAKEKLFLPVTHAGNPDYTYMEQYMKHIETRLLTEYIRYMESRLADT